MPIYAQLRTVLGELDMFKIDSGIPRVITVAVYRHHGDHTDGIEDSWFIEVIIELTGHKGKIARPRATMNALANHGKPKAECADIARDILIKGEILLSQWSVETLG